MNRHIIGLMVVGFVALLTLRVADAGDEEKPNLERLMKGQKKAMKSIFQSVQSKKKKGVLDGAKSLLESSKKVTDLAPPEVTSDEDKKKWKDFAATLVDTSKALSEAANAASSGDAYWNDMSEAMQNTSDSCTACHDVFAKKDDEGGGDGK